METLWTKMAVLSAEIKVQIEEWNALRLVGDVLPAEKDAFRQKANVFKVRVDALGVEVKAKSDAVTDMGRITNASLQDVQRCWSMLAGDADQDEQSIQFWRRTFVRACFALIEGTIFRMKQVAFEYRDGVDFLPAELDWLREIRYELQSTGEVDKDKPVNNGIPFLTNVRFAFRALIHATSADYQLEIGGVGWQSFRTAVKIRDRLMHPKVVRDLDVSQDQMVDVEEALYWFVDSLVDAIAAGEIGRCP